jgi:hypothetical protein
MRLPLFLVTFASLALAFALALAPSACSSSSGGCTEPPTPDPAIPVQAPCGLTFASVGSSGPCQSGGTTALPSVTGTGSGTCTVTATFTNGAHASGSVDFVSSGVCDYYSASADAVTLTISGSTGCDAGAPSDATPG